MLKKGLVYSVILFVSISCVNRSNKNSLEYDSHSKGNIKIFIDESFKKLFETSIDTFVSQNPKATIHAEYIAETNVIQSLFDNKTKTIVISRDLTKKEKDFLKSKQVEVRSNQIALDGIGLIVHPSNKDTLLTIKDLKSILLGGKKIWSNGNLIQVVFDQPNSSNFNYLKEFCDGGAIENHVSAVKSNEEVIRFVQKNPNAIGVIGINWISDLQDFDTNDFLDGIKVVAVGKDNVSGFYQPYPGVIYTKEYPLTREIWMINKGKRSGLNSGFVNFMTSPTGQLIVQQSSLVPYNAPIRLIEFRTK
jgi:phosphate transport system substrate-binding protein